MGPILVVVAHILRHQPLQMPLIHDDHMVQQVSSATSYPTLSNTVLPRTAKSSAHWLGSHFPCRRDHVTTKLRIVIEQQKFVNSGVRPCFPHLLRDPKGIGIARHIETQNLSSLVADLSALVEANVRPLALTDGSPASAARREYGVLPTLGSRQPFERSAPEFPCSPAFGRRLAWLCRAISNTGENQPDATPPQFVA